MGAAEPPRTWAGHCICNLSPTLLPRQDQVGVIVRVRRWTMAVFDLPMGKSAPVFGAGAGPAMGRGAGSGRPRCGLGYRRLGCPPLRRVFFSVSGAATGAKGQRLIASQLILNDR